MLHFSSYGKEMYKLLPTLSLPQRLIYCIFHPFILSFLLISLLTIWTTYIILIALLDPLSTSDVRTGTIGAQSITTTTATATVTATKVTSSAVSSTLVNSYSFNTSIVQNIASDFIQQRLNDANSSLYSYVTQDIYPNWQQSIGDWNASLSNIANTKKLAYEYLLSCNDTITTQLYQKSIKINDTLDLLSQSALIVGNTNSQGIIANLSVDYWFVSDLFANISRDMETLANLSQSVTLPSVSNATMNFFPNITSNFFNSTVLNFTNALMDIQTSDNFTLYSKLASTRNLLKKRSETVITVGDVDQSRLYKRCQILSVICIIFCLFSMIAFSCYEWMKYRYERSSFNIHMAYMIDREESSHANDASTIKAQQKIRELTQRLSFSISEILVYQVSNLIKAGMDIEEPRWKRVSHFTWWICSSGKNLWILLFYVVVHWQLVSSVSSLANITTDIDVDTSSVVSKYTGLVPREVTSYPSNNPLVYSMVVEACTNFEASFENTLNASTTSQLEATLAKQAADINSQINKLSDTITVVTTPSWEDLNYSNSVNLQSIVGNTNTTDRLSYDILSQAVSEDVSVEITEEKQSNSLSKRENNSKIVRSIPLWKSLYRWGILAILIVITIHHVLGYAIVVRL